MHRPRPAFRDALREDHADRFASRGLSAGVAAALLLAGCAANPETRPGTSAPTPSPEAVAVQPAGNPTEVATGLAAPWSIVRLPSGGVLVSERDTGVIQRFDEPSAGSGRPAALEPVGTVPGVAPGGEGGLLGLAALDDGREQWIYAYFTAAEDNRIVRMTYEEAGSGDARLGEPEVVLDGIPKAGHHNGGRIAFGPDGMLYATTGDAGRPERAQDPGSLSGKLLRMTPTGGVPRDNPVAGSLLYSMGHRNPQGLAWDDDGQLWAAEFGQSTWDEFNRIDPGANYGWPVVEGQVGDARFVDPVLQWSTDEASPSGLVFIDGTFFLAALRGERVWAITVDDDGSASATPWFVDEHGRIRDVVSGPDGTLWFVTNNTDGRGDPRDGDDRILEVPLAPPVDEATGPGRD